MSFETEPSFNIKGAIVTPIASAECRCTDCQQGNLVANQSLTAFPAVSSFFSGIGGFDRGFALAGFRVTFQCEINPYCRSILRQHWPEVEPQEDIKKIAKTGIIPFSDVWAGGFPCQDVSLARMGPRAGLKGKQSGLFHEFSGLAAHYLPRIVLIENVPGLLSSHDGRDFAVVVRTLAELGYSVGWRVLNSKNFGVPQSRQRVFIVGCYGEARGPSEILFESERGEGDYQTSRPDGKRVISPFKESVGDTVKGPVVKKLAHCLYACSARHTGTDWSRNYASYPDGRVRRLVPVECERLQGFPDGWTIPVEDKFLNADDLDSLRYYALGNAVTVPVATWLAARISRYLATHPRQGKVSHAGGSDILDAGVNVDPLAIGPLAKSQERATKKTRRS